MNSIMEKIKMICACVGIIEKKERKKIIRKENHYRTHFRHRKDMYRNKGQKKKD